MLLRTLMAWPRDEPRTIAAQLLNEASDVERRETFDGRLVALSRTHDLLVRDSWEGASLRDLLLQEFEPYRSGEGARIVIHGPDLGLNPKAALTLGMAFHELTTNAAKYGALLKPAGQVRVTIGRRGPNRVRSKRLDLYDGNTARCRGGRKINDAH